MTVSTSDSSRTTGAQLLAKSVVLMAEEGAQGGRAVEKRFVQVEQDCRAHLSIITLPLTHRAGVFEIVRDRITTGGQALQLQDGPGIPAAIVSVQ